MSNHRNSLSQLNKLLPVPITLEDRTSIHTFDQSSHITDVLVGDYHIIEGEGGKPYIVWSIKVIINELNHSSIVIYKRYRDIEAFRNNLVEYHKSIEIPKLPGKDNFKLQRFVWSSHWLEKRRKGLQWFMTNVLLNPKLQHSPMIAKFILE